jgi:hypothetical protein
MAMTSEENTAEEITVYTLSSTHTYTYAHTHVSLSRIFADGNIIQNIRQDTKFTPFCIVATVVGVM